MSCNGCLWAVYHGVFFFKIKYVLGLLIFSLNCYILKIMCVFHCYVLHESMTLLDLVMTFDFVFLIPNKIDVLS